MSNRGEVFFKNRPAGRIVKRADGSFLFTYEDKSPSVSLTLPNIEKEYEAEELFPFFDGLIPEGWLLNLAQKNWKIPTDDRMTLLLTTCQDCIGAVHVLEDKSEKREDLEPVKDSVSENEYDFSTEQCLVCMEPLTSETLYHRKCAMDLFGFSHAPVISINSDDMEKLALLQINQRLTLTGVQKKLSLSSVIENKKERLTVVGLDGRYILKPSTPDFPEMAQIEHLCMKLAQMQKIPMAQSGLVYLADGELAYLTRRFDRRGNEKIPMEDFCQLSLKPTSKKYIGSSEGLGKIIDRYSSMPQDDKLTLFQIILFSFWIGNSDMHLKNFSLWRDPETDLIRMSPGYDFLSTRLLIPEKEDIEELALPVNGRKNKLKWDDFLVLGKSYKIPEKVLVRVKEQMLDSFFDADALIEKSFLSVEMKETFRDLLIERSERLSERRKNV